MFAFNGIKLPYYAVIFTSVLSDNVAGYNEAANRMEALAKHYAGFLGIESVRDGKNGITVSYWATLESIAKWKQDVQHLGAQKAGRDGWYSSYEVRIAKVEREYKF